MFRAVRMFSVSAGARSELKKQLMTDMKAAMKAKDSVRLQTLRSIRGTVTAGEKTAGESFTDGQVLAVIRKLAAQSEESALAFEAAGRSEQAADERAEKAIIEAYLPAQMDGAAVEEAVAKAVADAGASSMKDMGKVMALLRPLMDEGVIDGKTVSSAVKSQLGSAK